MKQKIKAFTLVELIVVITILAILGTIAFISLSYQNSLARNAKVSSDISRIVNAFEAIRTTEQISLAESVTNIQTANNIGTSEDITLNNSAIVSIGEPSLNYVVGNIDFKKIKQNGEAFQDPNSFDKKQDYVFATVGHTEGSVYQFGGQIIKDDSKYVLLKGTYFPAIQTGIAPSLISTRANDTPVEAEVEISGDLYQ